MYGSKTQLLEKVVGGYNSLSLIDGGKRGPGEGCKYFSCSYRQDLAMIDEYNMVNFYS